MTPKKGGVATHQIESMWIGLASIRSGCALVRSRRITLYRFFLVFPSGGAGLALLGLRMMCGLSAVALGAACADGWSLSWPSRVVGLLLIANGLLLSLGLFTRIAGATAPLLVASAVFHWLLPSSPWVAEIRAVALPFTVISLSLIGLGPGAYSIDARLFGRRQLDILSSKSSNES